MQKKLKEKTSFAKTFQQLYARHKVIIELTSLTLAPTSQRMWACSGPLSSSVDFVIPMLTLTDAHLIGGTFSVFGCLNSDLLVIDIRQGDESVGEY